MKRREFMREYFARMALTFLLLCLIVYTVYHAVGNSSGSLQTTPARQISDVQLLGGEAWLFRDEVLLTVSQPGLVNSVAKSGTKVGKNAPLTDVWVGTPTEELAGKQSELDRINRTVEVLESSQLPAGASVSAADGYRSDAMRTLMEIRQVIQDGDWSRISDLEDEMLVLLNRYGALTGSEELLENALTEAKEERQKLLTGERITLSNELSSAYYYGMSEVDGYESLFTEEALGELTVERFAELRAAEATAPADSFVVGKLCYGYSWHLAVDFGDGAGALFAPETEYLFRFPESGGMELSLLCERVLTGQDGSTVVIFGSEVTPLEFRFLRSQSVEITVGSNSGFYIPQQALVVQNGVTGVYVFEDSTVRFRRIAVLYEGDGYLIAAQTDGQPEHEIPYLALNDLIVTSGKNLYDGKVYQ